MFLVLLFGIVILDQVTKYLAYVYLQPQNTIPVINNFFYLTYLENRNAVSDSLRDGPWFIISIAGIIVISALFYNLTRHGINEAAKIGTALISAGIIGNFIDSLRNGYIIHFLDFSIWPILNVADISAALGCMILISLLFFKGKDRAA